MADLKAKVGNPIKLLKIVSNILTNIAGEEGTAEKCPAKEQESFLQSKNPGPAKVRIN